MAQAIDPTDVSVSLCKARKALRRSRTTVLGLDSRTATRTPTNAEGEKMMTKDDKKRLFAELKHIAEETRQFRPPYIPSRYLQDLANSDPAELIYKYVVAKKPTDGFARLWEEK